MVSMPRPARPAAPRRNLLSAATRRLLPAAGPGAVLPAWVALVLAVLGGIGSAAQGAVNAELGARVGAASMGAVVNNAGALLILLVVVAVAPSTRSGLVQLWRARLPWWTYLGGLGGTCFLVAGTYAIPALGVAIFTIAQVAGNSAGGLAVDRSGLAPTGRLALTTPRVVGALLAVGAVSLAQLGRPVGELAVGGLLLAVFAGVAVAVQSAVNARLSAIGGTGAGTTVNFVVSSVGVLVVAAALGAFAGFGEIDWPTEWYLYLGGAFGVTIVAVVLVAVRSVGVLRTGLAIVAGQLGGALLLDTAMTGAAPHVAVVAGVLLTVAAVVVSGWRATGTPLRRTT